MNRWLPYISWICAARKVDALLVAALIETESGGNPHKAFYDSDHTPLEKPVQWAEKLGLPTNTERMYQRTQWGLLQIYGTVARQRGFDLPEMTLLCQPAINLEVGLRHIEWLIPQVHSEDDLIVAWRYGLSRQMHSSTYSQEQQAYLQQVKTHIVAIQALSTAKK